VLAHGTLPQHLPGIKKVEALVFHKSCRFPEHENMAVDTRVVLAPEPTRRIDQEGKVGLRNIPFNEEKAQMSRRFPGPLRSEKWGDKNHPHHFYPLFP